MGAKVTLEECAVIADRCKGWAQGLRLRGEFIQPVGTRKGKRRGALVFDLDEFAALLKARKDQGRHMTFKKRNGVAS